MIRIRPEGPGDYAAIHEVQRLAFGREGEAHLVDTLRQSPSFIRELSLVADRDGRVMGHILFTPAVVKCERCTAPALALAPLAVRPEVQNQGIGSALVRRGLAEAQRLGHTAVVVVGHPAYYPRFGFSSARAKGLEAPFPVRDEAFMVLELVPGTVTGIRGMVEYLPAFRDV